MPRTLRRYSPVGTSISPHGRCLPVSSAVRRGDSRHTVSTFTNSQPDGIAVQPVSTENWRYLRKTPDRYIGVCASSAVPPPSTPGIGSSVTGAAASHTTAAGLASPGTNRRPGWPRSCRCRVDPGRRLSQGAGLARGESDAAARCEDESGHGQHEAEQQAHQQQRIVDRGGGVGSDLDETGR